MDTEELLVHHSRQGKTAEGFHASFVDGLAVFVFAYEGVNERAKRRTSISSRSMREGRKKAGRAGKEKELRK